MLATDRCDRCGAQAYAFAILDAAELLFCAYHWREHGPAIIAAGHSHHDGTAALSSPAHGPTPSPRATTSGDAGPS